MSFFYYFISDMNLYYVCFIYKKIREIQTVKFRFKPLFSEKR